MKKVNSFGSNKESGYQILSEAGVSSVLASEVIGLGEVEDSSYFHESPSREGVMQIVRPYLSSDLYNHLSSLSKSKFNSEIVRLYKSRWKSKSSKDAPGKSPRFVDHPSLGVIEVGVPSFSVLTIYQGTEDQLLESVAISKLCEVTGKIGTVGQGLVNKVQINGITYDPTFEDFGSAIEYYSNLSDQPPYVKESSRKKTLSKKQRLEELFITILDDRVGGSYTIDFPANVSMTFEDMYKGEGLKAMDGEGVVIRSLHERKKGVMNWNTLGKALDIYKKECPDSYKNWEEEIPDIGGRIVEILLFGKLIS